MSVATLVIGPEHHGQPMSLDEFENAEVREGYLYELGRGVVAVIGVPKKPHLQQWKAVNRQLHDYDSRNPGEIDTIATGGNCKILLSGSNSERHPDLAIYKTPMPDCDNAWAIWVPEIVVEIVSPVSRHRDCHEKREEYLEFGIQEYWTVDAERQLLTVLQRARGKWSERIVKPPAKHATHLLPGFELDVQAVFKAAAGA